MKLKKYYLILLFLIFVKCENSNTLPDTLITQTQNNTPNIGKNTHTLTVFVHGTILPLPSISCFFSSLKDGFKKSRTEKKAWTDYYYEELRYKSLFKCQPRANFGLEDISALDPQNVKKYPYAKISADLYANSYNFANQEAKSNLHFYTFGWDGYLSRKSRIRNAKILYENLLEELKNIKTKFNLADLDIELILIGHSHGGNVLLNLAKIEAELHHNLKVDKLIMLGTPVQSETETLINDPMFKKIYSLYSNSDMVQIMDIFSTQDSNSKRRFNKEISLNSERHPKLVQIELKIGSKKPNHNELWLFGDKANIVYRSNLAINPLPAFVFAPIIINQIESKHCQACDMFAHIDKDNNSQNFTIKLSDKTSLDNKETLTSMPSQILCTNI